MQSIASNKYWCHAKDCANNCIIQLHKYAQISRPHPVHASLASSRPLKNSKHYQQHNPVPRLLVTELLRRHRNLCSFAKPLMALTLPRPLQTQATPPPIKAPAAFPSQDPYTH